MARKLSKAQVDLIVQNFVVAANRKHDGYAYTAGYLQSLVSSLLMKIPAQEQEAQIKILLTSPVYK